MVEITGQGVDGQASPRPGEAPGQSMQGLVADALRETSTLAQKEFALFRTEMSENLGKVVTGLVMVIAAGVFGVASLIMFTQALVDWLATVVGSEALASLIAAVITLVVALPLVLYGRRLISAATLTPTRTARSLRRDTEGISERVSA